MPPLNASSMPSAERVSLAKQRTRKVVDQLRASIEMHEANAIVVYSPTLAEQIPESHAAHAFNQFQSSMYFFEIIRLCALWDGADRDKGHPVGPMGSSFPSKHGEDIRNQRSRGSPRTASDVPTIIELIDDAYI